MVSNCRGYLGDCACTSSVLLVHELSQFFTLECSELNGGFLHAYFVARLLMAVSAHSYQKAGEAQEKGFFKAVRCVRPTTNTINNKQNPKSFNTRSVK